MKDLNTPSMPSIGEEKMTKEVEEAVRMKREITNVRHKISELHKLDEQLSTELDVLFYTVLTPEQQNEYWRILAKRKSY